MKRVAFAFLASALAAGLALAAWFLLGNDSSTGAVTPGEFPEAKPEPRDDRREEQAARLRRVLENRRRGPELPEGQPPAPDAKGEPSAEERSPDRLSNQDKAALRRVMEGFYSPERLQDALANRTVPDLVREMNRAYDEAMAAGELDDPAVREALHRMGLLKNYGMNVLHAQRAEGKEDLQRQMVERVNASFAERIHALNVDYPFLGATMVEP